MPATGRDARSALRPNHRGKATRLRTLATSFLVASCLVGLTVDDLSAQGTCPGTPLVETLGIGTPGAAGIPELKVQGAPVVGMPFLLKVSGAVPLAEGFLFVGTSAEPTFLPKFGATFFPAPPTITLPFVAGADGGAQLASFTALEAEFCGLDVVLQAAVWDGATMGGAALTAGLHVAFGPATAPGLLFPGAQSAAGSGPTSVAISDLNQDGLPDLAVANGHSSNVSVLLNQL